LRINVNGTNLATNARLASGSTGTYTFSVNGGDVVQFYWINGGTFDKECAFAVYYSDDPPNLAFNPSTGTTGGKVLASKRYNNPSGAVGDGTLMGSFTAIGSQTPLAGKPVFVGETIAADTANLGGNGTISYQWNKGGTEASTTPIPDANSGTYTVQIADAGSVITVTVTRAGCSGGVTSLATGTVNLQTPVASDYNFGKMSQAVLGTITAVRITPKDGKSPGTVRNIRYEGSTTVPQTAGTYAVTFDVAAAPGWNEATGLSAGNLVVNDWTAVTNSTFGSSYIYGVAFGNGRWLAVSESGKMAYSDNGTTWTAVTNSRFDSSYIFGVAYGNGRWVAVGSGGGKMAYSDNGTTWTAVTNSTFGNSDIFGVAYGNGRWVAVGSGGKMAYSDNGTTWTAVTNSTFGSSSDIYGVAYGNGRWVAVGSDGKMAYSDNGTTWTAVTDSTFTSYIESVAYGGGRWVAVGYDGMAESDDGTTWTAAISTTFGSPDIESVAYGGGRWVAVGAGGKMAYFVDEE
jgi:hypothetical protein